MNYSSWEMLQKQIIQCRRCPRLVRFRETVPISNSFKGETCWRKPVPGFGDPNAYLCIVGLAPSAQGGNRTGRIFTADASAQFLMKGLYAKGFANQPFSHDRKDGLLLKGCYITAAVKCVPPKNSPMAKERDNCFEYLVAELFFLKKVSAILALGHFAFRSILHYFVYTGASRDAVRSCRFSHGARYALPSMPILYASFHPSPQNTNTGKLTEKMFVDLLHTIKKKRSNG